MKDAKTVVADFLATFSTGNVDAILDAMADGATWQVMGRLEGMSGTYAKEELGRLLRGAVALYREGALRITPTSMIAEGDKVAAEAESFATMTNGRVYNNGYHFLFEVSGEKVLRVREYMDTLHAWDVFFKP
jgi:ketosteroid isomerase-like protein